MSKLTEWIRLGRERSASDLHLEPGSPLVYRVRGELVTVGEPLAGDAVMQAARQVLGGERWRDFESRRSGDLSQTIAGTRCRINVFQTVRGISLAIRLLSSFQNTLRECNLHPDLRKLIEPETGLVLVSGPTGSGKSTTMAALIEEINRSRRRNILTIESPIEYFFANRQSFIRQREVQSHTPSFEQAIIDSMREDPDILVVGEMRTPDVMRLTLNAAETGHLVLATLHSSTSAEALSRLCMSFAPEVQASVRAQLADCLVAVVCQRLEYLPEHRIQIPILEILMANSAVRSVIRAGSFSQILSAIQAGGEDGMMSFERYRRWIEQKRDWVHPSQATPIDETRESARPAAPLPPIRTPSNVKRPEASDPTRIEIPAEEDDLEALAKKITD